MSRRKGNLKKAAQAQKMKRKPVTLIPKRKVKKAIPGSGGILVRIQKRLGCTYTALKKAVSRSHWQDVRDLIQEEKERLGDTSEATIQYLIEQRNDLKVAGQNARWYLERQHADRGYKDKKELTIEGGENPLKHEATISVDNLELPLETRIKLLEALEKADGEGKKDE